VACSSALAGGADAPRFEPAALSVRALVKARRNGGATGFRLVASCLPRHA